LPPSITGSTSLRRCSVKFMRCKYGRSRTALHPTPEQRNSTHSCSCTQLGGSMDVLVAASS
jgi:hypothetical protein